MKHYSLHTFFIFLIAISYPVRAQVVTSDPAIPLPDQPVTIYFDAALGDAGLLDYTGEVYAYTGVLTTESKTGNEWKYVQSLWEDHTPETKLTRIAPNLYSLFITPSIRDYYGVPLTDTITHLAFVFRSFDNAFTGRDAGGADIFLEVFQEGFRILIISPEKNIITPVQSDVLFKAVVSEASSVSLFLNNIEVKTETGTEINHTFNFAESGDYWIKAEATLEEKRDADSVFVHVLETESAVPVPEGLHDGINYLDDHTAGLVLFAPGKEHVFAIGDFNDWIPASSGRMNRDNDRYWITLENLEPGREYAFQYLIDGELLIADPYTEKVLDPWNDKWIPSDTYPDLKAYPSEKSSGITAVLEPARDTYEWQVSSFTPPKKEDLVIYEMLVRDFVEAHDWKTLTDTLDYFTTLGINAIELMPVNEFEGNESWGYNPSFYFAPDKYYGPADDLKIFIDSCHARGIAVIIDMVLNHSYGQSPLVQLYFDSSSGKVSEDNPWYNVDSPNQVYSWGYDFNHESQATRDFVDRVNAHWITEYMVDGFRFDFTKGFTNRPGDGWAYDASRIAILKRMADRIWDLNPEAYVILEHLADNSEEKELAAYGMMLWGNMNYNYNEATMGYNETGKSDFSWISYRKRGWPEPRLVGYMESHDEERLMFKNLEYGNASGSYSVKSLPTALARMELAGAFFFTIPGPKMMWQFGELGYDISIDYDCRVCNKPVRWDYFSVKEREHLYRVWSSIIALRIEEPAFETGDFTLSLSGAVKRIELNHPDMDVRIIGNFDVVSQQADPAFSATGTWYEFFSGDSLLAGDAPLPVYLRPGEYRMYTTKKLESPKTSPPQTNPKLLRVYPNPVGDMLFFDPVSVPAELEITDLFGKTVMAEELEAYQDRIDVSTLRSGLHIVTRFTPGFRPKHAKVVKVQNR
ncbi:MAG: T9SS type A sorting domain-containing protein [Bacteroidales bacterium]|nr:T9SS type A sorting domain-containing protein [Bacteroidales bacterium]MBN2699042.1 T9SS type A sorting domain-containing protein [Bacteroidales bacterium]